MDAAARLEERSWLLLNGARFLRFYIPQEVLDKAFRRAGKQSDLVEDPDKYHRVRKQMARMVQAASDTIAETLLKWVDQWLSLNAQSEFDQALVDAAVGADEFRRNLGAIQWAAERVRK